MTFVGLAFIGTGAVILWAAITGESAIDAAAEALGGAGADSTADPADLTIDITPRRTAV